jgi:two-component system chemotaxis response regulator CheY
MAKIIIVDGSSVARFSLRYWLEKNGHKVVGEAVNGQEALNLYRNTRPDIVLLDIYLPEDNGLRILKEIISYDKNANVVMCSSAALQNIIIEAHQLGAKYFLVKPFTGKTVGDAIQKVSESQKSLQDSLIKMH